MSLLGSILGVGGDAVAKPIEALGNVFDKLFTSDEERLQAQAVLEKLKQHEDELQVELNKIEAANSSVFVAGWRPAIGWVCAASLAVYYIPRFVVGTAMWCQAAWGQQTLPPMPEMGIGDILGLVGSLLGMSWLRTAEKKAGVAR
ncbi:MAG: 3TM-type holin [Bacteroidota bacterium]